MVRILSALGIEDVCLGTGAACVAVGIGAAFGWPFGLAALGMLLVAYGVWVAGSEG